MKILKLILFSFLLTRFSFAQSLKKEQVIYLKNEWVIRGQIILQNAGGVKIRSSDGNIYFFNRTDIIKITEENRWNNFIYKQKGFAHFTELGPLVAGKTTQDGVTTAAFSFETVNGYKFCQYAFAGMGVGADLYATQTILPLFASFRGDIIKEGSVIPYYYGDLGYGFNITGSSSSLNSFKGGLHYAIGMGLKIPFNRNAGFLLSLGYNYQKTSYLSQGVQTNQDYNRLAVRAGFFL